MIRKLSAILILAALAAWCGAPAGDAPGAKGEKGDDCKRPFVGNANCKLCHNEAETGEQFKKWQASPHAKAFKTLSSPAAKKINENAAKDPKCLKCHVTGFECPKEIKAKAKESDGVGCESCHGAGKDYAKQEIMKSKKDSIEKGMIEPTEKTCVKCHNKESPTFPGKFDFKEMWKKILHPNPLLKHEKK